MAAIITCAACAVPCALRRRSALSVVVYSFVRRSFAVDFVPPSLARCCFAQGQDLVTKSELQICNFVMQDPCSIG
jgi:hypothetical protein